MKRCTRCILPENYPNISFDEQGVCNCCSSYESPTYLGEAEFEKLLSEAKAQGGEYDCLVPLSGGRDSTFVLHQLVKRHGAKVIAYHFDNELISSAAGENIDRATAKLGVNVVHQKMPDGLYESYLRELVVLGVKKSISHLPFFLCSLCGHGIWGGAYKFASERGIPLVVFGESRMEKGYAKQVIGAEIGQAGPVEKAKYALKMPINFVKRRRFAGRLRDFFPRRDQYDGIVSVNYFDYLKWDENRMLSAIREDLDWGEEKGGDPWRFDCMVHALVNHLNYSLYGFSEKEELLSRMINEGMVDRPAALQRVERDSETVAQEREVIQRVFQQLNLDEKVAGKIMAALDRDDQAVPNPS
jgi:hypothetical protein